MGGQVVSMGEQFLAVVTQIFTTIGEVVTTISSKPLLLIPVAFTFAGGGIGLAKSLMGSRRKRR